jgi:hypothetical protein
MVNGDPQEAIVINVTYELKDEKIEPRARVINERSKALADATYKWAKALYRDMFA